MLYSKVIDVQFMYSICLKLNIDYTIYSNSVF